MEYTVLVRWAREGGYWAEVPVLPGCVSQGEAFEETLANVAEAISLYPEVKREKGQAVPVEEEVFVGKVVVPAASPRPRRRPTVRRPGAAAA